MKELDLNACRDLYGFTPLKTVPVGQVYRLTCPRMDGTRATLNLRVREVDHENDYSGVSACVGCFFDWHPVEMNNKYHQCALFKICTSANRPDHKSVIFSLER